MFEPKSSRNAQCFTDDYISMILIHAPLDNEGSTKQSLQSDVVDSVEISFELLLIELQTEEQKMRGQLRIGARNCNCACSGRILPHARIAFVDPDMPGKTTRWEMRATAV